VWLDVGGLACYRRHSATGRNTQFLLPYTEASGRVGSYARVLAIPRPLPPPPWARRRVCMLPNMPAPLALPPITCPHPLMRGFIPDLPAYACLRDCRWADVYVVDRRGRRGPCLDLARAAGQPWSRRQRCVTRPLACGRGPRVCVRTFLNAFLHDWLPAMHIDVAILHLCEALHLSALSITAGCLSSKIQTITLAT